MVDVKLLNGKLSKILSKIQSELSSGLIYIHTRINSNTSKTIEVSSFLYALIELLSDKGLISIEEIDERKKQVSERLIRKFVESGIGLMYQEPEYDKYNYEGEACVNCESRLDVCKARCCKLPFALSKQDVEEWIIRWEFGRPYLIAHDRDGYCVHLDRKTYQCTAHEQRPVPCRSFDCKGNEKWKVWKDYDKKILNHDLDEQINQSNLKFYNYSK